MRLYVTRQDAARARYLDRQQHGDVRKYYELDGAIIVLRNGHDLAHLIAKVVDTAIGWDIAQQGFVLNEGRIGTRRTKITIFRSLNERRGRCPSLSEQIRKKQHG